MIKEMRGAVLSASVAALLAISSLAIAQTPSTTAPAGAASGGRSSTLPPATRTSPSTPSTGKPATGTAMSTGEFATDAQAKAHCPADTVVWANLSSKIYHFSGHKDYGTTKHGAYMCEKEADAAGIRAAKNEKHP